MFRPTLTLFAALAFTTLASAQINPTGPFTGSQSEGFETQISPPFVPCIIGRVFNNTADMCTPGHSGTNITGGWGFICSIYPNSGSELYGSADGFTEITFDNPVTRFGGYFGVNWQVGDGVANFFDSNGAQIGGSQMISAPPNCTWNWNGWDAGSAVIKTIDIYGPITFGGPFMMMDDLQYDGSGGGSPGSDVCLPGQGGISNCPCANPPSGGSRGCDNSAATGGAQLSSSGSASLAGDTVVFSTTDEKPTATSVVLQGDLLNSTGIVFGQGIRCAAGVLKRLYVKTASGGSITAPQGTDLSVSARSAALGDTISAGTMRWYSVYYRDPVVLGGCSALSTFNITQTQQVTWGP